MGPWSLPSLLFLQADMVSSATKCRRAALLCLILFVVPSLGNGPRYPMHGCIDAYADCCSGLHMRRVLQNRENTGIESEWNVIHRCITFALTPSLATGLATGLAFLF